MDTNPYEPPQGAEQAEPAQPVRKWYYPALNDALLVLIVVCVVTWLRRPGLEEFLNGAIIVTLTALICMPIFRFFTVKR